MKIKMPKQYWEILLRDLNIWINSDDTEYLLKFKDYDYPITLIKDENEKCYAKTR
jgi:hypothetical protein